MPAPSGALSTCTERSRVPRRHLLSFQFTLPPCRLERGAPCARCRCTRCCSSLRMVRHTGGHVDRVGMGATEHQVRTQLSPRFCCFCRVANACLVLRSLTIENALHQPITVLPLLSVVNVASARVRCMASARVPLQILQTGHSREAAQFELTIRPQVSRWSGAANVSGSGGEQERLTLPTFISRWLVARTADGAVAEEATGSPRTSCPCTCVQARSWLAGTSELAMLRGE